MFHLSLFSFIYAMKQLFGEGLSRQHVGRDLLPRKDSLSAADRLNFCLKRRLLAHHHHPSKELHAHHHHHELSNRVYCRGIKQSPPRLLAALRTDRLFFEVFCCSLKRAQNRNVHRRPT